MALSGEARIDALVVELEAFGYRFSPEVTGSALDGSGSEKYGESDWTAAGQDADGFPVKKGSKKDVTKE